jgi:hypothetical protein
MSSLPSDMVAICDQVNEQFWIYYVDEDGYIAVFKGPKSGAKEDTVKETPYSGPFQLCFNNDANTPVVTNSKSPKLAVCDYVRVVDLKKVYEVCYSFLTPVLHEHHPITRSYWRRITNHNAVHRLVCTTSTKTTVSQRSAGPAAQGKAGIEASSQPCASLSLRVPF